MDDDGALRNEARSAMSLCLCLALPTGAGTYADDAVGADELDVLVRHGTLGVALGVGLDVAEVADVTLLVRGSTVLLAVGVDCPGVVCVSASERPLAERTKAMTCCPLPGEAMGEEGDIQ